jgi:predicted dinucleotide-binding enzyme
MQAGIVGSGNIGSAVARKLVALGHEVRMANSRGPQTLAMQAERIGIVPATLEQAVQARDFVLLAVPEYAMAQLPAGLFAACPADATILDAGNYYPGVRDGRIAAIDAGQPDSAWVAERIGRPVVKMFNTIHADRIVAGGLPQGAPGRICLPVAGDDPAAKARAIALAEAMGFDGLDTGTLAESWRQQPGTPVYCRHLELEETRAALAAARPEAVAHAREEALARAREWSEQGQQVGVWDASS